MKKKGFTLIELLVVIAIIGLLATLAVISFTNAQTKARDAKRVSDMKQLQTALESYGSQAGSYAFSDCANGSIIKNCENAEFKIIIPALDEITDPSWEKIKTACINGTTSNCDYGWGNRTASEYYVFFATEGSSVQGLVDGTAHTLSTKGVD